MKYGAQYKWLAMLGCGAESCRFESEFGQPMTGNLSDNLVVNGYILENGKVAKNQCTQDTVGL